MSDNQDNMIIDKIEISGKKWIKDSSNISSRIKSEQRGQFIRILADRFLAMEKTLKVYG